MFKKVVVGIDLSPAEQSMMDCLPDLRRWGVEDIILVHIIRVGYAQWEGFGHEEDYVTWIEEKAELLRNAGIRIAVKVRSSGNVADELLTIAREEEASLLVVGSRSHNLNHTIFLGSVAKNVLRKSSLPVLLERIEATPEGTEIVCSSVCWDKVTNLLLATDFSNHSRHAEEVAINLLRFCDAARFISVTEPTDHEEEIADDEDGLVAKLIKLAEQAHEYSELIEVVAMAGIPAKIIAQTGEDMGAMLIIVGKHGRGWLEQTVIGTVAESVCLIAKRPVLVVP